MFSIATDSKIRRKDSDLFDILCSHFGKTINLARIRFMALLISALCKMQTVSFGRLALAFGGAAEASSNMRRIQRFMSGYALDLSLIARFIFRLLPHDGPYTLSMDRTNWQFGSFKINALVLGVTYEGVAFPLLFKLIDARWPLSLQVHPNERNASRTGGEPKTELWYVVDAEPGAALYAGFKRRMDEDELRAVVAQGPILLDKLNPILVKPGDMLYIPGGMPHAIGGGCFIYEIQQSSDTTYRFYDWDRKDKEGRKRPLHIEESFRSLDYTIPPPRVHQKDVMNTPFFRMRVVPLPSALTVRTDGSSFVAGFVLSGATDVSCWSRTAMRSARSHRVPARVRTT